MILQIAIEDREDGLEIDEEEKGIEDNETNRGEPNKYKGSYCRPIELVFAPCVFDSLKREEEENHCESDQAHHFKNTDSKQLSKRPVIGYLFSALIRHC